MARPEKDSCDFFFTNTKLLYDTKIKALRRHFKADGKANDAFFVFDYLFREIFGNEGYYIGYTDDLVGDTADFCYLTESFVRRVIGKCVDIGLFHKEQFEENGILTSRAIQKKYESITARRAKQKIESRFCVLDEELMYAKTELMSAETGLMSAEIPHSKRIEKESNRKEKENGVSFVLPFEDDSPVMGIVRKVIADEGLQKAVRDFIESRYIDHDAINEIRIGLLIKKLFTLATDTKTQIEIVDLATMKNWKDFFPPKDKSDGKPQKADGKAKSRIIQPDEQVGTWSWAKQPEPQ